MNVEQFVMNALQKKYSLDRSVDLENFNYVENGYVDSLGIVLFVTELEEHFHIEFSDEELMSPSFQTIGGLIRMIESKVQNK